MTSQFDFTNYQSCDIVDSSDNHLNWINVINLTGSICYFEINTSNTQDQQIIYFNITDQNGQIYQISDPTNLEIFPSLRISNDPCTLTTQYQILSDQSLILLTQYQNSNGVANTYSESINMDTYFTPPSSTCTYQTCSIVQSDGVTACPQAQLSYVSANIFTLTRTTTNIQLNQACMIKCILSGGTSTIQTSLFNVKVDYQCNLSSSYIETTLPAININQQTGATFNKIIAISSIVNSISGSSCSLNNCQLSAYFNPTCSDSLTQSWVTQQIGSTATTVNIDQNNIQSLTYFCVKCNNNLDQSVILTKKIQIQVQCNQMIPLTTITSNQAFSYDLQTPQQQNPLAINLNIQDYFNNPSGQLCSYSQCQLVDASQTVLSQITFQSINSTTCTLSVNSTNAIALTNAKLSLISSDITLSTIYSNTITFQLTDQCNTKSYYINGTVTNIKANQYDNNVTNQINQQSYTLNISSYINQPFYFCLYSSCSIVQSNGSSCSQVTFSSIGNNLFNLILNTANIQLTQTCKINCNLPNGQNSINTRLFNVMVDYKCNLSSSYNETQLAPIILQKASGIISAQNIVISSFQSAYNGSTCSLQNCELLSYLSSSCQVSVTQSWITQQTTSNIMTISIDQSSIQNQASFCIQCKSGQQNVLLNNKLDIKVQCNPLVSLSINSSLIYDIQNPLYSKPYHNISLDLSNYFTIPSDGVCIYTSCQLTDSSGNQISKVTAIGFNSSYCNFQVDMSSILASQNLKLQLINSDSSFSTLSSNLISFQLTDDCNDKQKYTIKYFFGFQQTQNQQNGVANKFSENINITSYLQSPQTYCVLNSCQILQNDLTSCPQAQLNLISGNIYNIDITTSQIQLFTQCMIKCSLPNQENTIQTNLSSVLIDYNCSLISSYNYGNLIYNLTRYQGSGHIQILNLMSQGFIPFTGSYCSIVNSYLNDYLATGCSVNFTSSWIWQNRTISITQVSTTSSQSLTQFCGTFTTSSYAVFTRNDIQIQIVGNCSNANDYLAYKVLSPNNIFSYNLNSGSQNQVTISLNISYFIDAPENGVCNYVSCSISTDKTTQIDSSYISGYVLNGFFCQITINTSLLQQSVAKYLKAVPQSVSPPVSFVSSNDLYFPVYDQPCSALGSSFVTNSSETIKMSFAAINNYLTVPWGRLFNYPLNQTCAIDFCYYSMVQQGTFDNITISSNNSFQIRSNCNDQNGWDYFKGSITCNTIGGITRTQNVEISCRGDDCRSFSDIWVSVGQHYLVGNHYEINQGTNQLYYQIVQTQQFIQQNMKYCSAQQCSIFLWQGTSCTSTPIEFITVTTDISGYQFLWTINTSQQRLAQYYCYSCYFFDIYESRISKPFVIDVGDTCRTNQTNRPPDIWDIRVIQNPQKIFGPYQISSFFSSTSCFTSCQIVYYRETDNQGCTGASVRSVISVSSFDTTSGNIYLSLDRSVKYGQEQFAYQCQSGNLQYCSLSFYVRVYGDIIDSNQWGNITREYMQFQFTGNNIVQWEWWLQDIFQLPETNANCSYINIITPTGQNCPQFSVEHAYFYDLKTITKSTDNFDGYQRLRFTEITTYIQLDVICRFQCNINDTNQIIYSDYFRVDVKYDCRRIESYIETYLPTLMLVQGEQNSSTSNQVFQTWSYTEFINPINSSQCPIHNCSLFLNTSNECLKLTNSFYYDDFQQPVNKTIDTTTQQQIQNYCIFCYFQWSHHGQWLSQIQLNNQITIGVCTYLSPLTLSSPYNLFSYIQFSGSGNKVILQFDTTIYFSNTTGVCNYVQCSIVDTQNNQVSWITTISYLSNICTFSIDTQAYVTASLKLQLSTNRTSAPKAYSNPFTVQITDICQYLPDFSAQTVSARNKTQFQSNGVTNTYTENIDMTTIITVPLSSCIFQSCSIIQSNGIACQQLSLVQTNGNIYNFVHSTTNIILVQQCKIKCYLTGGLNYLETNLFDVKVDYECTSASSYTYSPITNILLETETNNTSTANRYFKTYALNSLVSSFSGSVCLITQCLLYPYITNICQTTNDQAWASNNFSGGQLNLVIDTSAYAAQKAFCLVCNTDQNTQVTLSNSINLGVCAKMQCKIIISPFNSLSYVQAPGSTNPTTVNLDISNYLNIPTGVCTYQSCGITDSLGNSLSYITNTLLNGNICSFSLNTQNILGLQSIIIKVIPTDATMSTIITNQFTIQITDVCLTNSLYSSLTAQSLSQLTQYQNSNGVANTYNESINMNTYFTPPLSTCTYQTCSIVQSDGVTACPQAFLSTGSGYILTLTRTTTNIQLSQKCMIKCILSDGINTIQTSLFDVKVDYQCNESSSYIETALAPIKIQQQIGMNSTQNLSLTSFVSSYPGSSCTLTQCQLYSYQNSICQNNLNEQWLSTSFSQNILAVNIDISNSQALTTFCMNCKNNLNTFLTLANQVQIKVQCNQLTSLNPITQNNQFSYIQYPGSINPLSLNLIISDYFSSPSGGACTYTQCQLTDELGNFLSWISSNQIIQTNCSLNIITSSIISQLYVKLLLIPTDSDLIQISSNLFKFEITDVCIQSSLYKNLSVSNIFLTQHISSDGVNDIYTEIKDMNSYFTAPLSTCIYSSCSIIQSNGQNCPQAQLNLRTNNQYNLVITTTAIQLSQQCKIQCTIPGGGSSVIYSSLFNIIIDYNCGLLSSYIQPNLSMTSLLRYNGVNNILQFSKTLSSFNSEYFQQYPSSSCSISSCNITSYSVNQCLDTLQTNWTNFTQNFSYIDIFYDTTNRQPATNFCVQCNTSNFGTINRQDIQVSVVGNCSIGQNYTNVTQLQQKSYTFQAYSGVNFFQNISFYIPSFIDAPEGITCLYQSCNIIDSNGTTPAWIQNVTLQFQNCSFFLKTDFLLSLTNLSLQLIPTSVSPVQKIQSQPFILSILQTCNEAIISLSQTIPLPTESQASQYQSIGSYPRLVIVLYANFTNQYIVNLTNRFVTTMSDACLITSYKIIQVIDFKSGLLVPTTTWQSLFTLDNIQGIFSVLDFSKLYSNYQIYIQASNNYGAQGGNKDYIIDISTVKAAQFAAIPSFITPPQPVTASFYFSQNSSDIYYFELPNTSQDVQNITINQNSLYPYISVNLSHITIDQSLMNKQDLGTKTITLILTNNLGANSNYTLKLKLTQANAPKNSSQQQQNNNSGSQNTQYISYGILAPQNSKISDQKENSNTVTQIIQQDNVKQQAQEELKIMAVSIKSTSNRGVMQLMFNQSIITEGLNISQINSTNTIIQIIPTDGRDQQSDFNFSSIGLTWNATAMTKNMLTIQLYFNDPSAISPSLQYDNIKISFNGSQYLLVSQDTGFTLDDKFLTLTTKVRGQLSNSTLAQSTQQAMESSKSGMLYLVIGGVSFKLIGSTDSMIMVLFARTVNIMIHLLLINQKFPAQVISCLSMLCSIVMFDVVDFFKIDKDEFISKYFDVKKQEIFKSPLSDQASELDYNVINSVLFLKTVGIILTFYLIKLFLVLLISLYRLMTGNEMGGERLLQILTKNMFFKEPIILGVEIIIECVISGYLTITNPILTTIGEWYSTIIAFYNITFCVFILPIFILIVASVKRETLQNETFKKMFEPLYQNLKLYSRKARFYYLWYWLRRILYIFILFIFSYDSSLQYIQLVSCIFLNYISIIIIAEQKAYINPVENKYEVFNEIMTIIATIHVCFFTDWIDDIQLQEILGYSMILTIGFFILVNIYKILKDFFDYIYLCFRYVYIRINNFLAKKYPSQFTKITNAKNQKQLELENLDPQKAIMIQNVERASQIVNILIDEKVKDQGPQQNNEQTNQDIKDPKTFAAARQLLKNRKRFQLNAENKIRNIVKNPKHFIQKMKMSQIADQNESMVSAKNKSFKQQDQSKEKMNFSFQKVPNQQLQNFKDDKQVDVKKMSDLYTQLVNIEQDLENYEQKQLNKNIEITNPSKPGESKFFKKPFLITVKRFKKIDVNDNQKQPKNLINNFMNQSNSDTISLIPENNKKANQHPSNIQSLDTLPENLDQMLYYLKKKHADSSKFYYFFNQHYPAFINSAFRLHSYKIKEHEKKIIERILQNVISNNEDQKTQLMKMHNIRTIANQFAIEEKRRIRQEQQVDADRFNPNTRLLQMTLAFSQIFPNA